MSTRTALLRLFVVSGIWGCNNVISSYLLREFSPLFLAFIRIVLTSLFLIALGFKEKKLRRPNHKEWVMLAFAGFFGTVLNQIFYFLGLNLSTAGNASLIIALAPIATLILARFWLGEALTFPKIFGCILGLGGVVVIILFRGGASGLTLGDVYLLGAMLSLAISLMFIRRLTYTMTPFEITLYSTLIATVLLAPAAGFESYLGEIRIGSGLWVWSLIVFIGMIGQCLAGILWNGGIAVVGAGTASMFMNIPPFIALVVAHITMGDPIYISQIIGGILILVGVGVANRRFSASPEAKQKGMAG